MKRREFMRTSLLAGVGAIAAGCGIGPGAGGGSKRPNILLIMTDQHRYDCLGCWGNAVIRTPNLDSIARDGVIFTSAYTSTPSCTPARSGLLTGLSPWHHGMLGYGRGARRYKYELPRMLRAAGYYTLGIGKMHWHPQRNLHGFHRTILDEEGRVESEGFVSDYHLWFREQAPGLDPDATGIGWNDYRSWPYALPEHLHPTYWTGTMAVEFLERYERSEPFFLKVSFARPHSPYDPPERFFEMYRDDEMPDPVVGAWAARFAPHAEPPPPNLWHGDLGLAQVRRSRRGYYGSVSFVDEQVGRILDVLRRRGFYDDTLILFCVDHGDMLGDHHHWRKTYAYEGSAHIPMLLKWPKSFGMDERRGGRIPQPVELRDVLPTFLDVAGMEVPPDMDGRSLLELVRGRTENWRPWIDLEHSMCYAPENYWNALTDGEWKYIFHAYTGEEQLFHLKEDPGELVDLAGDPDYADILREWRERLVEHLSERGERYVADGQLVVRKEPILYSPHFPDLKERLRRARRRGRSKRTA